MLSKQVSQGSRQHPLIVYLLALMIVLGIASLTCPLLVPLAFNLGAFNLEGILLLAGIVVIALVWGTGPSLLATGVSAGILFRLVVAPHFLGQRQDPTAVVMLVVGGMGISLLASLDGWAGRQATGLARSLSQEGAARAAEFETLFEAMTDGIFVYTRDGYIQRSNAAARQLYGLGGQPEFLSLSLQERAIRYAPRDEKGQPVPLERVTPARLLHGEVLTSAQPIEDHLHTPDGREVILSITGRPLRNAEGIITGAVTIARDVTERRHLEEQTRKALDALLAMAEALVQVPASTSLASNGTAAEANEVARRLAALTRSVLGFEHVSMVAVTPETETLVPITVVNHSPEYEQAWWATWDQTRHLSDSLLPREVAALQAGEPVLHQHQQGCCAQGCSPDGASLLVPMSMGQTLVGALQLDKGAQVKLARDENRPALIKAVARLGALVLERERLLRERAEAQARELLLRETTTRMETFLGVTGHEIKTPLTSIMLSLQVAERRMQRLVQRQTIAATDGAFYLEQLEHALHQAERLDRLVNDVLDISRIHAGKLDLRTEPTDLAAIVRQAVAEQRQIQAARTLTVQFPDDWRVPITADADRIEQVVTNYLTNALKYSPAEQPVAVGLDVTGSEARVWVRDQGPGLPPEEQERIWERFHRAQGIAVQSGSGVGLGLGLYICRTIIQRHQGQVGVESTPGQGSTFWFTLPLPFTQPKAPRSVS